MNGYVSRPRLAAIAICLTVLVVAGVGYSVEDTATLCLKAEAMLNQVRDMIVDCEEFGDCMVLFELQGSLVCIIDDCWDAVDGVCSLPAG